MVEQVDRDAAWPYIPSNSIAGADRDGFFNGKYDDCQAVQAFAKHRIAAEARGMEAAARIVEGASKRMATKDMREMLLLQAKAIRASIGQEHSSEVERLRDENGRLLGEINGYKDALAQAEGIIEELNGGQHE